MKMLETDYKKKNFLELLLDLHDTGSVFIRDATLCSDNVGNSCKQQGNYVVMYYLGNTSLMPQNGRTPFEQLCVIKEAFLYLINCCCNTKGMLLWWYDDGMLEELVKKCDEQGEAKGLLDDILDACSASDKIVHDKSKDEAVARAEADMLYGDESSFDGYFLAHGKPIVRQDLYRQSLSASYTTLDNWLEQVSFDKLSFLDMPESWEKNTHECRIYIVYLDASTLLAYATEVIYRLKKTILKWVYSPRTYCIWLGDRRLTAVLEMLQDTCAMEFQALRDRVIDSGQCIYDEQHNLQQYITLADGYYGDYLPGVEAIGAKGKPVVILNFYGYSGIFPDRVAKKYQNHGVGLQFTGGCWGGDEFFFCSLQSNGLYKYNRGNENAILVSHVPVKNVCGFRYALFSTVVPYRDKLYCIPTMAERLMIYDKNSGQWDSVILSDKYMADNKLLFGDVYVMGEYIWMLPLGYSAVVRMNLLTLEILYISGWNKEMLSYVKKPMFQYYSGMAVFNESLYFVANQSQHIVEINMQTLKSRVYEIAGMDRGFISIAFDGGDLWLTGNGGSLLRWHPVEGVMGYWDNLFGEEQDYASVIYHSGNVWLFAWWCDKYVRYDLKKDEFEVVDHYLPEDLRGGLGATTLRADDKYIYIYPNAGELLVRFDVKTGKVEAKSIRVSEAMFWKYYPAEEKKSVVDESVFIDTNEMSIYMKSSKINHKLIDVCGENIYKKVMDL